MSVGTERCFDHNVSIYFYLYILKAFFTLIEGIMMVSRGFTCLIESFSFAHKLTALFVSIFKRFLANSYSAGVDP